MKRAIAVILVLGGIGAAAWWVFHSRAADNPTSPAITAKVHRGDLELTVEATGSVESNRDVEIKSKASGEIIKLPYDVSDRVPRHMPGRNDEQALLAVLDPNDEQRRVERAEAGADAATAKVDQAEQGLRIAGADLATARPRLEAGVSAAEARARLASLTSQRKLELQKRNAATQDEVDAAVAEAQIADAQLQAARAERDALAVLELTVKLRQADVDLAKANLAAAQTDLAEARRRLAETRVYSPIDGVVTQRNVQIGQIIASGIVNIAGGTTLMTVSDLSRMYVMAVVDESDIGRLVETARLGQDVTITADAYPGRRFTGKVVQITPRGTAEAKVISFNVKVEITGGGAHLLLPKMTADVSILAERKAGVLLAPNAAVLYDRDQPYVRVRRGGAFVRQDARLGANDGRQAEVLEGLADGDEVELVGELRTRWSNEGRQAEPATQATQPR